jgi:hypothetical protein
VIISLKEILWKQFGAAIDMLENAMLACPDELWSTGSNFWYQSYHCLFYLDYYLSNDPAQFLPLPPFTLSELDSEGLLPERVYSKEELLTYLEHGRNKCHSLIAGLTEKTINDRWKNEYRDYSIVEILLYNMRHVQHHTGQLNLLLRQNIDSAPRWVSQAKMNL